VDLSAEANGVSESHSECMDEVTSADMAIKKTRMFRDRVEPTS